MNMVDGFEVPLPSFPDYAEIAARRGREIRKNEELTRQFQQQSLETLNKIEQNTAVLRQIHDLLQAESTRRDEMFNLITEILSVMKAQNKEEAQSLFGKIMDKVNRYSTNAETMVKLYGFATTVLQIYHSIQG